MGTEKGVSVAELIDHLKLKLFNEDADTSRRIRTVDINRPGLALAGYFRYHPADRIQLMGRTEMSLLDAMEEREQDLRLFALCSYEKTPCFVVSRGFEPPAALLREASARGLPVLGSPMVTTLR